MNTRAEDAWALSMLLGAFLLARLAELETAIETEIETGAPLFAPPQQLLADIAAKRQIIDLHQHVPSSLGIRVKPGEQPFGCAICAFNDGVWPAGWCPTLLALALPYADHPDYDERWKP